MSESTYAFFSIDPADYALPLTVSSIGLSQDQKQITRENGFEHFHFFRCMGGEGKLIAGGRAFSIRENMAVILFPAEPHCYYPVREPWIVDWITFTGAKAPAFLGYLGIEQTTAFELLYPGMLASDMANFLSILKGSKLSQKLDASCQLCKTLASLYGSAPSGKNQPRGLQYRKIEPSIRYIEQRYFQPITLEQLAGEAGVSPKYFCRLFQEAMHVRPFQFINSYRINECKRLLLETREMNIREVASRCGYENISYFNQVFKDATGMSPMEFRQLN